MLDCIWLQNSRNKKYFVIPYLKEKLHLVEAKKFTCDSLKLVDCDTETLIQISKEKIEKQKIF